jgi:hypothetical protein
VIARRAVVRLIGATVTGLAILSGSIPAVGASGPNASPNASPERAASVLPFATGDTGLELTLTKVSPAAVGPDDEVMITGSVRNLDSVARKNVRISLWLRPDVLTDRRAINSWLSEGTLTSTDRQLPATALVRSLPSGQSAPFRLQVAPGQTGLFSGSSFGPRPIALQARTGGRRMATLRSTLVWAPTGITTPTRLSVVVPITASTPSTHAGEATAETAASLMPGGRLQRVLSAAHAQAMAWAIDPAILVAAQRLSTDGIDPSPDDADLTDPDNDPTDAPNATSSPTSSGSSATTPPISDENARQGAQDWLTLFQTERRDVDGERGLFGLPYADPDLTSVLRSPKAIPLIKNSDALGREATSQVLRGSIDTTVALPADGRINATTTRSLIRLKRTAVILSARSQQPEPELDHTPTGRSTIRSSAGDLTGLLYDEQLSTLISSSAAQTPAATQTLLAQLAAITMEQPGTGRHLLAVTPRTWNPDPTAARNMMNALGSAPWISLRGIDELREASDPPRRRPSYGKAATQAELPPGTITAAQVLEKGLTTFAPALVDPAPVKPLRERVASLLSVAWRQDRSQFVAARESVAKDVNSLVEGVRLSVAPSYRFTARKTKFPIIVVNETDYAVKVSVRLKPQTGQLSFASADAIRVEPQGSATVLLEAQAVSSGDVVVEGKLLSTGGSAVGPGVTFTIHVRPNWESWGMIVIGSLLGFLLVIGLLRGLRRNRSRARVPIEAVPDVDEQATRRADEAASAGPNGSSGPTGSTGPTGPTESAEPTGPGAGNGPAGANSPVGATAAAGAPGPVGTGPVTAVRTRLSPEAEPVPEPDPEPVPDPVPVPISMPEAETDPKAGGGPVEPDGVRPTTGTRVGR